MAVVPLLKISIAYITSALYISPENAREDDDCANNSREVS
jgi:hypothetical protein